MPIWRAIPETVDQPNRRCHRHPFNHHRGDEWIEIEFDNFDVYLADTSVERLSRRVFAVTADDAFIQMMKGAPTYIGFVNALEAEFKLDKSGTF